MTKLFAFFPSRLRRRIFFCRVSFRRVMRYFAGHAVDGRETTTMLRLVFPVAAESEGLEVRPSLAAAAAAARHKSYKAATSGHLKRTALGCNALRTDADIAYIAYIANTRIAFVPSQAALSHNFSSEGTLFASFLCFDIAGLGVTNKFRPRVLHYLYITQ